MPDPPQVVSSSPSPGQVLGQAPTQITVQFSEPVNIRQLAYQAYEVTYLPSLPQVFVEGADGTIYYPRFLNYDSLTNTATFQMLDGLPNGSYALHFSGQGGLTDLGGDPLPGNDPSGDYVIPFAVQGPDRGVSGSMSAGFRILSQAGQGVPQDIGMLFPDELQGGVDILRYPEASTDPGAGSLQDDYVIQVLQHQQYSFQLLGSDLPADAQVTLTDASGQSIPLASAGDGGQSIPLAPAAGGLLYTAPLDPGTYTVSVSGWSAGESADIAYQLVLYLTQIEDNAPPLVDGPSPALQVSFDTSVDFSGSTSSGGSTNAGGPGAFGPISGITGGSISGITGGPSSGVTGPVGSIASSGPVSSVSTGGAGSASPANSAALSLSQADAAGGLAGLGMGPLGGSGGQSGLLASPTVQVALNVPSPLAPASNSLAVSLVTLTQVFSWNGEAEGKGERTEAANAADPQGVPPSDPSGESAGALTAVQADAAAGPHGYAPSDEPGPAMETAPAQGLAILADPPALATPEVPIAVGDARSSGEHALAVVVPTPPEPTVAVAPRFGADTWAARWAITAATLIAVYRARTVVRGLEWRKRTGVAGARPDGRIAPRAPDTPTTIALQASESYSVPAASPRSGRGVQAALPCR